MLRAVLLCSLLGGCAILKTTPVETVGPEKCSTGVGAPAVDTLMVAGLAAFAVFASYQLEDVDHIAIPVAIGTGLVYAISAGVGYSRASRCKQAKIKNGIAY